MHDPTTSPLQRIVPAAYLELLALRRARLPLIASAIGRLPFGAAGLAMLVLVQHATGSFASAGVTEACFTVGAGVAGPAQGRLVDHLGQTRPMIASALASSATAVLLVVAAHNRASLVLLSCLSLLAGLSVPPLSVCMRALWADLLTDAEALHSAYAFDAVVIEVVFIAGPLIAGGLIAAFSPSAAVLASTALGAVGALAFAASPASRRWLGADGGARHWAGPLRSPGILVLAGVACAFGVGIGAMELALIAFGKAHGSAAIAGPLISTQAVASLAGGIWSGARNWRTPLTQRYVRLNLLVALGFLPLVLVPPPAAMAALMLFSGFGLAPVSAASFALIERLAPPAHRTEAFGWAITGTVLGIGVGSVVGGAIVNGGHLRLGFLAAAAGMFGAWLIALAGRRLLAAPSRPVDKVAV